MTENERLLEGRLQRTEHDLAFEMRLRQSAETRLLISNNLVALLTEAYDGLLHHGINYQALRVYKEADNPLHDTTKRPEHEAKSILVRWIGRMHNDLKAAVRRKALRNVKPS